MNKRRTLLFPAKEASKWPAPQFAQTFVQGLVSIGSGKSPK